LGRALADADFVRALDVRVDFAGRALVLDVERGEVLVEEAIERQYRFNPMRPRCHTSHACRIPTDYPGTP